MNFYKNAFDPQDMRDSARGLAMPMMNLFKMNTHWERTHMENILDVKMIYDPVDIDLHQRILVDPAYRIWRAHQLNVKHHAYEKAF